MNIIHLINKKQNNLELSEADFDFFVKNSLSGDIKEYQIASFLMLIWCSGLSEKETFFLTKAMVNNGEIINYQNINHPIIDKHSTGGIGDKVSLIIVPLLASCGLIFAKMSGRGLGYTGGTIDKLESVGIQTELTSSQYIDILKKCNMFIISQSKEIAPSDKIFYAIRDTTGTVNNLSLIASSIMSKKIATNTDKIYLDVKVGNGSFFKDLDEAKKFAKLCINIGGFFNKKVMIHLTNMDKPLGRSIGNMIEVREAINFLNGKFESEELKELIYDFAIDILIENNICKNKEESIRMLDHKISSKMAYIKFKEWAKLQKSDFDFDSINKIYNPKYKYEIFAIKDGYVDFKSNKEFGYKLVDLKAGRLNKEDKLDFYSGIYLNKVFNEFVKKGELVFTVYCSNPVDQKILDSLQDNIIYNQKKQIKIPNIIGVM